MKNIIITGCARGLGNSLLKELIQRRYTVIPHFKTKPEDNYNIKIVGDITQKNTIKLIDMAIIENDINVIINNAAIYSNMNVLEMPDNEIKNIINTDLLSQILITKYAYKYFRQKNNGLIVNINSLAGKYPSAKESIYSAAKFGLNGFSKALQLDCIGSNVKIIDFYIGAMKTDMSKWRVDYDSLLNPNSVAKYISDIISDKYKDLNLIEHIIRRV